MENKEALYEWKAPARYFEKKPSSYFRAIVVLGAVLSLLLYFFSQYLLILVAWVVIFVTYVKATVMPPQITYQLTQFGLQFLNEIHPYKSFIAFTIINRPAGIVARLFNDSPRSIEVNIVLPKNKTEAEKIIEYLQKKVPYVNNAPVNSIERFGNTLQRLTGLG